MDLANGGIVIAGKDMVILVAHCIFLAFGLSFYIGTPEKTGITDLK